MKKTALILEGGGLRTLFSAGILDVFMENNIKIDTIFGVSAGALFGVNYFSNQKGRTIRYTKKYALDKRYISKKNLILTGNIVSKKFAYYKVTKKLDPFDNKTFKKSKKKFYAVITNVKTGKPEYIKITDVLNDMEYLRATSAVPLVSRIVKINKNKYLDGGLSDSVPIKKCQSLGYEKIIVILTRPLDYQKKSISGKNKMLLKMKYFKYPKLLDTIFKRHKVYNDTINKIKVMEANKEIFVIRPRKDLDISTFEKDISKIDITYNEGVKEAKNNINKIKKYLK